MRIRTDDSKDPTEKETSIRWLRGTRKKLGGWLIASLLVITVSRVWALQLEPQLFVGTDAAFDTERALEADTSLVRMRLVEIRFDMIGGAGLRDVSPMTSLQAFQLNLFGDVAPTVILEQVEVNSIGGYSWIGRIKEEQDSSVVLVVKDGVMSGSIRFSDELYQVRYAGDGAHAVTELDASQSRPEAEPIPVVPEFAAADLPPVALLDDGTIFDVMVVYTPSARSSMGGTTAMETRIQLGITETNQGFANSNIIPRLNLVHTEEMSYTESAGSMADDLNRLTATSDGYMDNVHTLRDTHGADLVSLIVNRTDYCGIAWLMTGGPQASFESYAFSVVDWSCISPYYSFGHELGHNLGCHHAPEDTTDTAGVYTYSFGYKEPSEWFRTVMAYNCPGGCTRVLHFSNPNVDYGGRTTGTATQDNARSINNVRTTAANWRTSVASTSTLSLDKSSLVFNATTNRAYITSSQTVRVNVGGTGTVNWSVSSNQPWVQVSPSSGTGRGSFTVSINSATVPLTSWNVTVSVTSSDVSNSPQTVGVSGTAYGSPSGPFGVFDTPVNGTTGITGAIAVTGWALDDIEVIGVQIWRDPVAGEGSSVIFVGDAVFVEGARSDIEAAYSGSPFSYRGGWGYMMLTNGLPNQGNGSYVIHAYATDQEGHQALLGSKTISVDNASAVLPFGTIDTPAQGGTTSGLYESWGWVLSPQNVIQADGSTIEVYVDGVLLGTLDYGYYRADIATAFPGYANSNNGVGVYNIDTTAYDNGVHTVGWYAVDNGGRAEGIGSRFFVIENTGSPDETDPTTRR